MDTYFKQASIITMDGCDYRIIHTDGEDVVLCQMNTNRFIIFHITQSILADRFRKKTMTARYEPEHVVPLTAMKESTRERFLYYKEIINRIEIEYGPEFTDFTHYMNLNRDTYTGADGSLIKNILSENRIKYKSLRRLILRYLQGGRREYAICDRRWIRKSGPEHNRRQQIPENWQEAYDDAIERYKALSDTAIKKHLYDDMIDDYFSEPAVSEEDGTYVSVIRPDHPSIWQFYRYINDVLSPKDQVIIVKGKKEYQNNHRLKTGSSDTGIEYPYEIVEMDAVEFDVSLVDSDGKECSVGRPIIYLMKDLRTKMLVAGSIGFDNNSIVGCTNCFANLNEDKRALCEKYDVEGFDETLWLTGYKPQAIRIDNGADFISGKIEKICEGLNIRRDIVPSAKGSAKGVVERAFHDAHQKLNAAFKGYGHIHNRYDSKHHEESTITISHFVQIFYNYIITYNKSINKGISLDKKMVEDRIPQIPALVMQYMLTYGHPQKLPQGDEYLIKLLIEGTAKLSNNGLMFKKLNYLITDDEDLLWQMQKLQSKSKNFPILYDPRSILKIFYVNKEHLLVRVPLNPNYKKQQSFGNMTFEMAEKLFKLIDEINMQYQPMSDQAGSRLRKIAKQIVTEAAKEKHGYSDTKNMRENRFIEKSKWSSQNALDERIGSQLPPLENTDEVPSLVDNITGTNASQEVLELDEGLSPAEKLKRISERNFKRNN